MSPQPPNSKDSKLTYSVQPEKLALTPPREPGLGTWSPPPPYRVDSTRWRPTLPCLPSRSCDESQT